MNIIKKVGQFFSKIFNKGWKIVVGVVVGILVFVGLYYYFNQPQPQATRYSTAIVSKASINESISAAGNFVSAKEQNLGFRTSGKITELNANIGDNIKAGQTLAKLDISTLQNTVSQSQIGLDQANNNFANRYKSSNNQYDVANMQEQINTATAKVNSDKANLNNYVLTSPKDGVISAINNSVGDSISGTGSPFVVISDSSSLNPKNVNFLTSGKIIEVDVSIGQTVTTGQILGKLDDSSAKTQLSQSQSSLNVAINNYNNRNKNSPNNYDTANLQDQINLAQIKLNNDTNALNQAILASDIDGTIVAINNNVGDNVSGSGNSTPSTTTSSSGNSNSSSGVMTVVDLSTLNINLSVPESDAVKIKSGQIVQITVDALGGKQFVGKVSLIDFKGTTSSNVVSFNTKISVDKLDNAVRPGMSASCNILVNTKDNILTVPNASIKSVNGQKTVQTYNNNVLESVVVTTGISNDTDTEILTGLQEGDVVVTGTISTGTTRPSTAGGTSLFNLGGATGGNRGTGATGGAAR